MAFFRVITAVLCACSFICPITARTTHRSERLIFYVGHQARGILTLEFDPLQNVSSSLNVLEINTQGGFLPQWLTSHEKMVYSVSREQFPTVNDTSGGVFSFRAVINAHQTKKSDKYHPLTFKSKSTSGGRGAVACDVSRDGRTVAAANIDGSSVSIHPISEGGIISAPTYIFNYTLVAPGPGAGGSQNQSNPHEAIFEPSGQYMFVPDRGADLVYVYSVAGPTVVFQIQTIAVEAGSGPRHLTFRKFNTTRTYMYLISELDNTVRIFTLDGVNNDFSSPTLPSNITISLKQLVSTLGPGSTRSPPNNHNLAAEIALSSDGHFVYASNRETTNLSLPDTLAIYAVNPGANNDASHLTYLGFNQTFGKTPRHFALSRDWGSKYAAIANEVTNSVVILERDEDMGFFVAERGFIKLGTTDVTTTKGPLAILWE